ncbi:unnamed protein product [Amoebophrya sp. A120]|nr:unnamed protein product [Amoebophrya sp. A120]|eukprot:GSA120T00012581001.1
MIRSLFSRFAPGASDHDGRRNMLHDKTTATEVGNENEKRPRTVVACSSDDTATLQQELPVVQPVVPSSSTAPSVSKINPLAPLVTRYVNALQMYKEKITTSRRRNWEPTAYPDGPTYYMEDLPLLIANGAFVPITTTATSSPTAHSCSFFLNSYVVVFKHDWFVLEKFSLIKEENFLPVLTDEGLLQQGSSVKKPNKSEELVSLTATNSLANSSASSGSSSSCSCTSSTAEEEVVQPCSAAGVIFAVDVEDKKNSTLSRDQDIDNYAKRDPASRSDVREDKEVTTATTTTEGDEVLVATTNNNYDHEKPREACPAPVPLNLDFLKVHSAAVEVVDEEVEREGAEEDNLRLLSSSAGEVQEPPVSLPLPGGLAHHDYGGREAYYTTPTYLATPPSSPTNKRKRARGINHGVATTGRTDESPFFTTSEHLLQGNSNPFHLAICFYEEENPQWGTTNAARPVEVPAQSQSGQQSSGNHSAASTYFLSKRPAFLADDLLQLGADRSRDAGGLGVGQEELEQHQQQQLFDNNVGPPRLPPHLDLFCSCEDDFEEEEVDLVTKKARKMEEHELEHQLVSDQEEEDFSRRATSGHHVGLGHEHVEQHEATRLTTSAAPDEAVVDQLQHSSSFMRWLQEQQTAQGQEQQSPTHLMFSFSSFQSAAAVAAEGSSYQDRPEEQMQQGVREPVQQQEVQEDRARALLQQQQQQRLEQQLLNDHLYHDELMYSFPSTGLSTVVQPEEDFREQMVSEREVANTQLDEVLVNEPEDDEAAEPCTTARSTGVHLAKGDHVKKREQEVDLQEIFTTAGGTDTVAPPSSFRLLQPVQLDVDVFAGADEMKEHLSFQHLLPELASKTSSRTSRVLSSSEDELHLDHSHLLAPPALAPTCGQQEQNLQQTVQHSSSEDELHLDVAHHFPKQALDSPPVMLHKEQEKQNVEITSTTNRKIQFCQSQNHFSQRAAFPSSSEDELHLEVHHHVNGKKIISSTGSSTRDLNLPNKNIGAMQTKQEELDERSLQNSIANNPINQMKYFDGAHQSQEPTDDEEDGSVDDSIDATQHDKDKSQGVPGVKEICEKLDLFLEELLGKDAEAGRGEDADPSPVVTTDTSPSAELVGTKMSSPRFFYYPEDQSRRLLKLDHEQQSKNLDGSASLNQTEDHPTDTSDLHYAFQLHLLHANRVAVSLHASPTVNSSNYHTEFDHMLGVYEVSQFKNEQQVVHWKEGSYAAQSVLDFFGCFLEQDYHSLDGELNVFKKGTTTSALDRQAHAPRIRTEAQLLQIQREMEKRLKQHSFFPNNSAGSSSSATIVSAVRGAAFFDEELLKEAMQKSPCTDSRGRQLERHARVRFIGFSPAHRVSLSTSSDTKDHAAPPPPPERSTTYQVAECGWIWEPENEKREDAWKLDVEKVKSGQHVVVNFEHPVVVHDEAFSKDGKMFSLQDVPDHQIGGRDEERSRILRTGANKNSNTNTTSGNEEKLQFAFYQEDRLHGAEGGPVVVRGKNIPTSRRRQSSQTADCQGEREFRPRSRRAPAGAGFGRATSKNASDERHSGRARKAARNVQNRPASSSNRRKRSSCSRRRIRTSLRDDEISRSRSSISGTEDQPPVPHPKASRKNGAALLLSGKQGTKVLHKTGKGATAAAKNPISASRTAQLDSAMKVKRAVKERRTKVAKSRTPGVAERTAESLDEQRSAAEKMANNARPAGSPVEQRQQQKLLRFYYPEPTAVQLGQPSGVSSKSSSKQATTSGVPMLDDALTDLLNAAVNSELAMQGQLQELLEGTTATTSKAIQKSSQQVVGSENINIAGVDYSSNANNTKTFQLNSENFEMQRNAMTKKFVPVTRVNQGSRGKNTGYNDSEDSENNYQDEEQTGGILYRSKKLSPGFYLSQVEDYDFSMDGTRISSSVIPNQQQEDENQVLNTYDPERVHVLWSAADWRFAERFGTKRPFPGFLDLECTVLSGRKSQWLWTTHEESAMANRGGRYGTTSLPPKNRGLSPFRNGETMRGRKGGGGMGALLGQQAGSTSGHQRRKVEGETAPVVPLTRDAGAEEPKRPIAGAAQATAPTPKDAAPGAPSTAAKMKSLTEEEKMFLKSRDQNIFVQWPSVNATFLSDYFVKDTSGGDDSQTKARGSASQRNKPSARMSATNATASTLRQKEKSVIQKMRMTRAVMLSSENAEPILLKSLNGVFEDLRRI